MTTKPIHSMRRLLARPWLQGYVSRIGTLDAAVSGARRMRPG
jgi:hypothetical protein